MAKHVTGSSATERSRPAPPVLVPEQGGPGAPRLPLLDLYETPGGLVVEMDLPGVRVEDIAVVVSRSDLTIEGTRRGPAEQERGCCFLRVERSTAGFHRVIPLPAAVDPHGASARYGRGVLTVTFPKIPDRRRETIKIPITAE